ncbi:hypothetical protein pqer_cds_865 [Pandoravirus quercus]|uniref:Uncharacterized protein n=2 Tax=Pandoravirus TaxID=2060084 RepID=A0A2U7UA17_9VIRU|nr:hypothetical protein pqer_cds_865 [Pandoravirus quercus]AVK75287.1 hypothetical protein pqer_cds_865 [Pandoravirus quercus]QBZ81470.1 hypothetical protein pclt_cds_883 [Pandoravirus celtis]
MDSAPPATPQPPLPSQEAHVGVVQLMRLLEIAETFRTMPPRQQLSTRSFNPLLGIPPGRVRAGSMAVRHLPVTRPQRKSSTPSCVANDAPAERVDIVSSDCPAAPLLDDRTNIAQADTDATGGTDRQHHQVPCTVNTQEAPPQTAPLDSVDCGPTDGQPDQSSQQEECPLHPRQRCDVCKGTRPTTKSHPVMPHAKRRDDWTRRVALLAMFMAVWTALFYIGCVSCMQ